ncbi:MAG: hypothetical protein AB8F65_14795 [Woeseiaceae bacterium]
MFFAERGAHLDMPVRDMVLADSAPIDGSEVDLMPQVDMTEVVATDLETATLAEPSTIMDFQDPSERDLTNIQYIIVTDVATAYHFANGCAFYELRSALNKILAEAMWEDDPVDASAVFSVRLVSSGEQRTLLIGDYWVSEAGEYAYLPPEALRPISKIIAVRPGKGGSKDAVEATVTRVLAQGNAVNDLTPGHCQSKPLKPTDTYHAANRTID